MKDRWEDTPDLFGRGCGSGTDAEIICEFCGTVHNKGIGLTDNDMREGESVLSTVFADKQICYCCFEKIESAVLSRIEDILTWYARILKTKEKDLEAKRKALDEVRGRKL